MPCKRQKIEAEWTEHRKGSELDEEMSKLFEDYLKFLLFINKFSLILNIHSEG